MLGKHSLKQPEDLLISAAHQLEEFLCAIFANGKVKIFAPKQVQVTSHYAPRHAANHHGPCEVPRGHRDPREGHVHCEVGQECDRRGATRHHEVVAVEEPHRKIHRWLVSFW